MNDHDITISTLTKDLAKAHARIAELEKLNAALDGVLRDRAIEREEWADAVRSVAPGSVPSPHAAKHAIAELKQKWDEAKKRVSELETRDSNLTFHDRNVMGVNQDLQRRLAEANARVADLEQQVAALQLVGGAALGNIAKSKAVASLVQDEVLQDLRKTIEIYENTLCAIGVELGKPDPTEIVSTLRARLKELIDEKQKRLAAEAEVTLAWLGLERIQDVVAPKLTKRLSPQAIADEIVQLLTDLRTTATQLEERLVRGDQGLERIQGIVSPDTLGRLSPARVADEVREMRDELLVARNNLCVAQEVLEECWPLVLKNAYSDVSGNADENASKESLVTRVGALIHKLPPEPADARCGMCHGAGERPRLGRCLACDGSGRQDSGRAARNETEARHDTSPGNTDSGDRGPGDSARGRGATGRPPGGGTGDVTGPAAPTPEPERASGDVLADACERARNYFKKDSSAYLAWSALDTLARELRKV